MQMTGPKSRNAGRLPPEETPLMRQYLDLKRHYPEAILFFRVGDFYEMFFEDARTAAGLLQITLTSRDKASETPIPLCGVPYHAARGYIAKLVSAGHSVALCEQMENPSTVRGTTKIVRREVVRVITPGTFIESDQLSPKEPHHLAALVLDRPTDPQTAGLAWMDLSTGDFRAFQTQADDPALEAKLHLLGPRELLLPEGIKFRSVALLPSRVQSLSLEHLSLRRARETLYDHFKVQTLAGLGCEEMPLAAAAAGALLGYVQETQKVALSNVTSLRTELHSPYLLLHATAQRHLDLLPKADRKGQNLLEVLDETCTAMGARQLREWLLHPLVDRVRILCRQQIVEAFLEDAPKRLRVQGVLRTMGDLERLIGRIGLLGAQPRDPVALMGSLAALPEVRKHLADLPVPLLQETLEDWEDLGELVETIRTTLSEQPPAVLKEGGVIREGHSPELDELRTVRQQAKSWLGHLEQQERAQTQIDSLKIRYNQIFGYYIEVTRPNLSKVPPHYQRKQTLTNAERFTTPELITLEGKILGAEEKQMALEAALFETLRQHIAAQAARIQKMARKVAHIDAFLSLAASAERRRYCKPEILEDRCIEIVGGRHPLLETLGPTGSFVPNDTDLREDAPLLVLTGPNMAGKSTYMRQIALIVLMAQMGGYVPAQSARIGWVDRIFTRVGAEDDITGGKSTFMVEMSEVAAILHHATDRSLILLDEVGRGTSTYDGVSIAWAIAEYLLDRLSSRTLFATHYHELTQLAEIHEGIRNANVAVREWNDEVVFLRKIVEGGADRSYGIQVARLAGLPNAVIARAKEILSGLESGRSPRIQARDSAETQGDLFAPAPHPAVVALRALDPDRMTPLEALKRLAELKHQAEAEG